MNVHEAILLAGVSLIAALGLQGPVPKLDWTGALPTYPIAAQVLRTGAFDRTRALDLMRGNRLRLTAIFFLLNLTSYQFYALIRPATNWITQLLVDPPSWTLREAIIRHVIQFPFDTFWVVAWAVTLGMVMKALALPMRRTGPTIAA